MSQLAVFDAFYQRPQPNVVPYDIVGRALASGEHEVLVQANTIYAGAMALAQMNRGKLDVPDVVIVGGRLEDDNTYFKEPAETTSQEEVTVRRFFFWPKTVTRPVATRLLPLPDAEGNMVLPTSHNSPISPRREAEQVAELNHALMADGRAAYVLSHLTRMLLPERTKIIGISAYNLMSDLPVDSVLDRQAHDAMKTVEQLRQTIAELLAE